MHRTYTGEPTPEQRATLALWALTGVGMGLLATLREDGGGSLASLLPLPVRQWSGRLEPKHPVALDELRRFARLEDVAQFVEKQLQDTRTRVTFPGEATFPERLVGARGMPAVLFWTGAPITQGKAVAMVGSREVDDRSLAVAHQWARVFAEHGVCVVSGAARGIDQASHQGAIAAGGKTWAFLGSSIDQVDAAQAAFAPKVLEAGGTLFSELPPGVRADKSTFPRRNRLISGASEAVLVLRAGAKSGAGYTAEEGVKQGRRVFAIPGELDNPLAVTCNALIRQGAATLCTSPAEVLEGMGFAKAHVRDVRANVRGDGPAEEPQVDLSTLSPAAQRAYAALRRAPQRFEDVLIATGEEPARLTIALTELELSGLAIQRPGKLFERI